MSNRAWQASRGEERLPPGGLAEGALRTDPGGGPTSWGGITEQERWARERCSTELLGPGALGTCPSFGFAFGALKEQVQSLGNLPCGFCYLSKIQYEGPHLGGWMRSVFGGVGAG